jgi:hypothetical protein
MQVPDSAGDKPLTTDFYKYRQLDHLNVCFNSGLTYSAWKDAVELGVTTCGRFIALCWREKCLKLLILRSRTEQNNWESPSVTFPVFDGTSGYVTCPGTL